MSRIFLLRDACSRSIPRAPARGSADLTRPEMSGPTRERGKRSSPGLWRTELIASPKRSRSFSTARQVFGAKLRNSAQALADRKRSACLSKAGCASQRKAAQKVVRQLEIRCSIRLSLGPGSFIHFFIHRPKYFGTFEITSGSDQFGVHL